MSVNQIDMEDGSQYLSGAEFYPDTDVNRV